MTQDINTTAITSNTLFTKKKTNVTNGTSITSGKINPIVDQKELNLVSGGLKETCGYSWFQGWARFSQ